MKTKRNLIFLLLILKICFFDMAADHIKKDPKELLDSQVAMLDDLIFMTKKTLQSELELKEDILRYQQIQEGYLKNPKDKELVIRMVQMADRILKKIEECHLIAQFDPDYISELAFFSKIANKKGIPKS